MPKSKAVVMSAPRRSLILGGARSGKSRFAESRLEATSKRLWYLATATPDDAEMRDRIARHQERRGERWQTHQEPLAIASWLDERGPDEAVLVDCLTLWLTNLMLADRDIEAETAALVRALAQSPAMIVLVSNEVGLGIVPDNAMARAFIDHAGLLHQRIAAVADQAIFMAAGLPLVLKGPALS